MDIELIRESIKIEQSIGQETAQILIEGDIIVPDVNPDISVVLENEVKVNMEKVEISEGRINYIGKLDVQVLYLAKGAEKPIHSMSTSMPIDEFINLEGINDTMWAEVIPTIQNVDYKILNDRKISLRAIVNISASGEKSDVVELVTDAKNLKPSQVKKNKISINTTIDSKNDRFIVKEQLSISSGSPNIKNILQSDAKIINKEIKTSNGKVQVEGEILISILYKGDSDESIIEIVEKEVSFNGSIEVHGANEDMYSTCDLIVQEFYNEIKQDQDGEDRIIDVEVSIGAHLKVSNEDQIEILEDAYIIGKDLVLEKKEIKYPKLICRNKNQSTIKDVIQVDGPDVLQIFKISGECLIDDITIQDDKVILDGIVNINVLYIAEDDTTPLCSYKTVLPYRQVIEARGAKSGMEKKIIGTVEHIGFNMLSNKEIELRILVSFNAQIIEINNHNVIIGADITDIPKEVIEKMASMVIYIVQKSDNLWSIAKKYNTDIDDIMEVNEIENPEIIFEGQKLLILKKVLL